MREVGEELITVYNNTGIQPFQGVQHQAQMTPLQLYVIKKTVKDRQDDKRKQMEEARNGNGPSTPTGTPTNAAHGGGGGGGDGINAPSKEDMYKQRAKEAYGADQTKTYQSQEYQGDETPSLIVNEANDDE